jgi:hypothetical protein
LCINESEYNSFCRYPSKDEKNRLAKAIITDFPGLKDPDGITGHVEYNCDFQLELNAAAFYPYFV